jgi:hypothetical protein
MTDSILLLPTSNKELDVVHSVLESAIATLLLLHTLCCWFLAAASHTMSCYGTLLLPLLLPPLLLAISY